jgi:hypothetical protein
LVPTSSTKRAWTALGALAAIALLTAGIYLYRTRGPLTGESDGSTPDMVVDLPPEAPAVAFIDVRALRKLQDSALIAVLGLASSDPHFDQEYKQFMHDTGFDYSRDLDRTAVAVWPAALLAPSRTPVDTQVLAIGDGRFDEQKIEAYALRSGKAATHGSQTLYELPGAPPVAIGFLSRSRIVLTSGAGAENHLLLPHPAKRDPVMQALIDRVSGAPVFAVARTDNLPSSLYDNLKNVPQFKSLAHSIQGLTLAGQPDGDVLHVILDGECDSATDAIKVATFLDGFRILGAMALSDPKARRQMTPEQFALLAALINQAKVTHQDHWVRLTVDITAAMMGDANIRSALDRQATDPLRF